MSYLSARQALLAHRCSRRCHGAYDLQPDWDPLRSVAALSILFLVLPTTPIPGTADKIPTSPAVSIRLALLHSLSYVFDDRLIILTGIEYAWNVFPSTSMSSGVLLASNSALLLGIWLGYAEGKPAI